MLFVIPGSTASMPVSPLIMGLLGTAGILATGVCLVLAALCRRHYARPCHRPDNGSKHVPMEAVIAADDLIVDGSITGVRTPLTPEQAIIAEPVRNCNSTEGSDPDIIRNQYGKLKLCQLGGWMDADGQPAPLWSCDCKGHRNNFNLATRN